MVFDTISPAPTPSTRANTLSTDRVRAFDHMYTSSDSSSIELPLSDERDLYQIEAANKQQHPSKWKMMSKRRQSCSSDMYATASRYHRIKPPQSSSSLSTTTTTTTTTAFSQLSSSDEVLPTPSTLFSSFSKFSHDDMKFYPNQSGHIATRRSTTDCNNLSTNIRRPNEQINQNLLAIVDEESRDSIWPSSDDHHLLLPHSQSSHISNQSLTMFYSHPSITPCSSISSFNSRSNSTDLHGSFYQDTPQTPKTFSSSSSSGYESNIPTTDSSLNSIPDHLLFSSPDSIVMPPPSKIPSHEHPPTNSDRNLVEQFIDLHLQKQTSFDHDVSYSPPSSFSSTSSSFLSQAPISTMNSPLCCRKCVNNQDQTNQLSSDTEDDSQSTTVTVNLLPSHHSQSQNKRPRSLPIAIQQPKGVNIDHHHANNNDDGDDDDDDASDDSLQNSLTCHCSKNSSRKKRFRACEFHQQPIFNAATSANGIFSENTLISSTTDKLHIDLKDLDEQNHSEQSTLKTQKISLEHFIMSPTDKVKVQMKYPSITNEKGSEIKSNELKISQPEDIDFKRSKQKAIRVLYQNRLNLNSIQSPVARQNSVVLSSRTTGNQCDSPLAQRTVNPRLLRSVLSCSVIEADDEHEVVSSSIVTKQSGVNGTREKSPIEIFNCLRSNFTESLLHGKILPCGILDGFTVKLGASGLFMPKQVVLPVTTFWFNVSEHQAASPYLGFINLQCLPKRGYHTPTKGTITLALLNPNGTAIHLFLILYDFSDMPPDHRTFIRQRIVLMPEDDTIDGVKPNQTSASKGSLRYLAHIRFVTSQTGKLYMHSDIRLIFARNKLDYDDRTAAGGKAQLVTLTDTPTPKYWSRK